MTATTKPFDLRSAIVEVAITDCDYYNGGWMKSITEIDRTKKNGYSLVGDFVEKEGLSLYDPGVYLLCDVQGSRKHHRKNYVVVAFDGEKVGKVAELEDGGRDWALQLWDDIEKALAKFNEIDPKQEAIDKIKSLMTEHGITVNELTN